MPELVDGCELAAGGEPFGGYSYLASACVLAPYDLSALAEELAVLLTDRADVLASASALRWAWWQSGCSPAPRRR